MFSHPRLKDIVKPPAPENARVQGAPGILLVAGAIISFALLFAVLAGAGMGLVVATRRTEVEL